MQGWRYIVTSLLQLHCKLLIVLLLHNVHGSGTLCKYETRYRYLERPVHGVINRAQTQPKEKWNNGLCKTNCSDPFLWQGSRRLDEIMAKIPCTFPCTYHMQILPATSMWLSFIIRSPCRADSFFLIYIVYLSCASLHFYKDTIF